MLKKESVFEFLRKRTDKIANSFLEPGETLLWSGIPGFVDVISREDLSLLPFFAVNAVIIYILFSYSRYFFYSGFARNPEPLPVFDYIITAEIIHILLILLLLTIRLLYRYFSTAGHVYAVTDRRVIIIRRKIKREINITDIKTVSVDKRLFGGSIVFNNGNDYFSKGGALNSHRRSLTAFFNIADLDGAMRSINNEQ